MELKPLNSLKRFGDLIALINDSFQNYRWAFLVIALFGFLSGLLGGLGISAIIPLFSFVVGDNNFGTDPISQTIIGGMKFIGLTPNIYWLIVLIVVVFIFKAIALFFINYYTEKLSTRYEEDYRRSLFTNLLNSRLDHFNQQKPGHLERLVMNDINQGAQVLTDTGGVILASTGLVVYAVVAYQLSPIVTVATLIPGLFFFWLLKSLFYRVRQVADWLIKIERAIAHQIIEQVTNIKLLKSFGGEAVAAADAAKNFSLLTKAQLSLVRYNLATGSVFEPASFIIIAGLFYLSYQSTNFNLASFAATIYLIQKIFAYLQSLQSKLQSLNKLVPHLRLIRDYQKTLTQVEEKKGGPLKFRFQQEFKFNEVGVDRGDRQDILNGVSFSFKPGEIIGLTGISGSGKTTIIDLLFRFIEPSRGEITVDGEPLKNFNLADWRHHLSAVPQEAPLISGNVAANIRFFDSTLSDTEVKKAATLAGCDDFIKDLPQGMKTEVGERGTKLSGGQRQRIALARALAKDSAILVLDEATNALDHESEEKIKQSIASLRGQKTIIIVAHQLKMLEICDRILKLENGLVTQEGASVVN
ncbi:MAG: ABC transporter ATP-binding protein [bacterium]|nr:ABC transporter ATP-binding protein [bacterium]